MDRDDAYFMMCVLGAFFGLAILMIGGNAQPPHRGVLAFGAPFFFLGAYGTLFYWVRSKFRR